MNTQLAVEKPTISILLYTDNPQFSTSKEFDQFFGLGLMIERLKGHAPKFAKIRTTLLNRTKRRHADTKLDTVLDKESFDEIWFFGTQQANTRREPESELTSNEVKALTRWMKGRAKDGSEGGGVLMTGDHADPPPAYRIRNPDGPCKDTSADVEHLGLGRAIGHCVPRAGLLRRWEGKTRNNTLAGPGFQMDRVPQELFLKNVNRYGDSDPDPDQKRRRPHPLFFYRSDQFIKVFPDHGHEGEVVIPKDLDASWPKGSRGRTKPQVVAKGKDRVNGNELNIIAAYNGDLAGVGRIVADSTWHHYTNLNLLGFEHPAPEGSFADQIGQFYANLAVWLAPRRKRIAMAHAMFSQIAEHMLQQEQLVDAESIGKAAQSVLMREASPCEAHELMEVVYAVAETAGGKGSDDDPQLRNKFLGNVVNLYHHAMVQDKNLDQSKPNGQREFNVKAVLDEAFKKAMAE